MQRRAQALEETRNRIVWAAMQLHSEKGVAITKQADIAARARVSPATVYRHFPTLGSLVTACGGQAWMAVGPPRTEDKKQLYAGLGTSRTRLRRFVEEVSEFYGRAWGPLESARQDRGRVPELDEDLRRIEADIEGLLREAVALEEVDERWVRVMLALTDFGVWKSLWDRGVPKDEIPKILSALLQCVEPSLK